MNKEPPKNIEAEKELISAAFLDDKILGEVALIVDEDDFYNPVTKEVFSAIMRLARRGSPVDMPSMVSELESTKMLDKIGGFEALSKLAMYAHTSVYALDHAKLIKQASFQRQVQEYARHIMRASTLTIDETIDALNGQPNLNISKNKHRKTSELIKHNIEDVIKRYHSDDDMRGMATGFIDLDNKTDGIKGAEVVGLYAESNAGKSIIASDIAINISKKYGNVALFAYEMLAEDITSRMLPRETGLDIDTFNKPKANMNKARLQMIEEYKPNLDRIHIFADELCRKTAHEVESHVSLISNCKLIIIDYLHLMKSMERTNNDIDKYTMVLRELKGVATRNRIPILLLMSQNKEGGFRGTEELRHDLDQLWELKRDGEDADQHVRETAEILVRKGRNNAKGKVELWYDEKHLTFRNKADEGMERGLPF